MTTMCKSSDKEKQEGFLPPRFRRRLDCRRGACVAVALFLIAGLSVAGQTTTTPVKAGTGMSAKGTAGRKPPAQASAAPKIVSCPPPQQPFISIPEISSGTTGKLKATLKVTDGTRTLWGDPGDSRCASQYLRVFTGYSTTNPSSTPFPNGPEPLPGPTLHARVGDLVEISFFNDVNINNYGSSLDQAEQGNTSGCDQYTTSTSTTSSKSGPAGGDTYPNCLHGSSTSNLHFHGTHTTPSTTGDNILQFIRPVLRVNGITQPAERETNSIFQQFFAQCEKQGSPASWSQMPLQWQSLQRRLLQQYDATAPYQGVNGALPPSMKLWPVNDKLIREGKWPEYQIGAYPYCFALPKYGAPNPVDPSGPVVIMGQAPGTHWYHAHKHGSTALNVANGMTGAFIIEGQYDDDLVKYYGENFRKTEKVMMIQQISSNPFPLTNPKTTGPGSVPRPSLSVNGRQQPVVSMNPGEVQLWRIINGAFRDAVQFIYFQVQPAGGASTPCSATQPPAPSPVQWRQIAQDGVQFNLWNYQHVGTVDAAFNVAPGNRADILVKAPAQTGIYTLCVVRNDALYTQGSTGAPDPPSPLLAVNVSGSPVSPAMEFIPDNNFPAFPPYLSDVKPNEIRAQRSMAFGAGNSTINGIPFNGKVQAAMTLDTAEEWTVSNLANDKSHPFHIHINPFQITALFEPNRPEAKDPKNPCYVNPNDPSTFKPCPQFQPQAPWIWWDTFAIPSAQQITLTSCTVLSQCPAELQPYTTCTTGKTPTCTETIPGWFKMRSRFVDFTGEYVTHCHILIHEDRGMMQLIEVVPNKSPYSHH